MAEDGRKLKKELVYKFFDENKFSKKELKLLIKYLEEYNDDYYIKIIEEYL